MHRVSLPVRNPTADFCLSRWTLENTPRTCSYRTRPLVVPSPLHHSTPTIMPLPFPLITDQLSRATDVILPFPQPHRWDPHSNFLCIHRECRNHTRVASPSLPIPRLQPTPPSPSHIHAHACEWRLGGWAPGRNRDMGEHPREVHGFTGNEKDFVRCYWGNCDKQLQQMNMGRHIMSTHLRETTTCHRCNKALSRPNADMLSVFSCC